MTSVTNNFNLTSNDTTYNFVQLHLNPILSSPVQANTNFHIPRIVAAHVYNSLTFSTNINGYAHSSEVKKQGKIWNLQVTFSIAEKSKKAWLACDLP